MTGENQVLRVAIALEIDPESAGTSTPPTQVIAVGPITDENKISYMQDCLKDDFGLDTETEIRPDSTEFIIIDEEPVVNGTVEKHDREPKAEQRESLKQYMGDLVARVTYYRHPIEIVGRLVKLKDDSSVFEHLDKAIR